MHRTILLCLVAGCGGSSVNEGAGPRGLNADQHLAIASRETERAGDMNHWPDERSGGEATQAADQRMIGNWFGTWDTVSEHRQAALAHRSAAAQIELEYEQACGDTPGTVASVSPLQRYGVGGTAVPGGMVVVLSAGSGSPDQLLSAMRCHRAWMMLGRTQMDDCPLDLPGLQVTAHGDASGVELTITVADPALVDELRRRAAHDLEASQRRPAAPH